MLASQATDRAKTANQQSKALAVQINEFQKSGDAQSAGSLRDQRVGLATEAGRPPTRRPRWSRALSGVPWQY